MKSIRRTLTVRLLVGSCILLAAIDIAVALSIGARLQREFDRGLEAKTRTIASLVEHKGEAIELDLADEYMPEYSSEDEPEYFQLFLADGASLEKSESLEDDDLPYTAGAAPRPAFRDVELPDGRPGRLVEYAFVPRHEEDDGEDPHAPGRRFVGTTEPVDAVLVVARERGELDALVRSIYVFLAALSLLYVAGIALVIRGSLRAGLAPLAEINREIEGVGGATLDERVHLGQPVEELNSVVEALNRMLDRVESAWKRERRFSSDVSHELRTPLAELRSLSEIGAKWPDDEATVRRFFDDVADITAQMEKLTSALMLIARSENQEEAVEREDVAVRDLVDACWRGVAKSAGARGVRLDNRVPDSFHLHTDATLLKTVVANILENAATYAVEGSVVECAARNLGGAFELGFANPSRDLDEEDLGLMFDRFWRKDASRTDGRHSGLGLSVVRALCDLLGYRVDVRLDAGGVFRLTVRSS